MTKRITAGRAALLVLLAGLLSGCALLRRGADDAVVYEPGPIMVAVANRNWSQVTIYVEILGQRRRLGDVPGVSAAEFELPGVFTARTDLRLVAAPLASRLSFRTGDIVVPPGATIHFSVENNLRLSSWVVR
jgi:hypothetical protein